MLDMPLVEHQNSRKTTLKMTATTLTHPEWDKETGGLAVAKAFAEQIRGKKGTYHNSFIKTVVIDHVLSPHHRRIPRINRLVNCP